MTDRGVHRGLARGERLRKRSAFLRAQQRGSRRSSRNFVVYALKRDGEGEGARLGITASKKVGKAVVRNRVKRWIREGYRQGDIRPPATDVVVIAKPSAGTLGYHVIAAELRQVLLSFKRP